MSEETSATGSCLCGAVTLRTSTMAQQFGACHCGMCRRWGGGPLLAIDCGSDVEIDGADSITVFDSSKWAERGFCKNCGTHLFYRIKQSQQCHIPVGLFGDSFTREFGRQVFIDKKPDSYSFSNETQNLAEAQIFEMYAPKS